MNLGTKQECIIKSEVCPVYFSLFIHSVVVGTPNFCSLSVADSLTDLSCDISIFLKLILLEWRGNTHALKLLSFAHCENEVHDKGTYCSTDQFVLFQL